MKLTVVVDNLVPISDSRPFLGEHGFSLLIEIETKKILLDTGQSDIVVKNLGLLGIHPNQLDAIVLSHGHYDHAGGLSFILQYRNTPIPVYGHPGIFQKRCSSSPGSKRYIGIPASREKLTAMGAQWHLTEMPFEIVPNLLFSGQIPRQTEYESGDTKLMLENDTPCGCQDTVNDDISLYYSCGGGLVVLGGCTHAGFVNTVENGFSLTGQKTLLGWAGGTHLGPAGKIQQEKTLTKIEAYAPKFLAAGHCTGFTMMAELARRLGERYVPSSVGRIIEVD